MAQYRIPHPYDARFAIPGNVMAESPGRHTLTTAQRPRRSFDSSGYIPPAWSAHFDLPEYVKAENQGRGAATTMQARRRTISQRLPDALGSTPLAYRLTQEVYALDGSDHFPRPGFPGDPFKMYGERVSELIMGTIWEVPQDLRKMALISLLNELESGLADKVAKRANKYEGSGMSPQEALLNAIASSTSEGLAMEIVEVGRSGKLPRYKSLAGLGAYEGAYEDALVSLGWSITGAVKTIGSGIKTAATWTGGKIASGARTTFSWGETALSKIRGLTCSVMNHSLSDIAAGAASAAAGAPPQAGMAGKQVVQGKVCPPGTVPSQAVLETPGGLISGGGLPKWVLPAGIGAAGLIAVLLLTKK